MFLTADNKIKWKLLGYAAAAVGAIIVAGLFWFDAPLYLFIRRFDWAPWGWIDKIFDAKVWLIASFAVLLVFYVKKCLISKPCFRNNRNRVSLVAFIRDFYLKTKHSYAFLTFCSVLGACVVAQVLKIVIGRFRPLFFEALDITGFRPFSTEWAFNSMPSGHAVASFAGLVMLGMLAPRIKWFTWTVAIIVGVSRVACGAHWPTDVIFGAFIGMVAADLVKSFFSRRA